MVFTVLGTGYHLWHCEDDKMNPERQGIYVRMLSKLRVCYLGSGNIELLLSDCWCFQEFVCIFLDNQRSCTLSSLCSPCHSVGGPGDRAVTEILENMAWWLGWLPHYSENRTKGLSHPCENTRDAVTPHQHNLHLLEGGVSGNVWDFTL